MKAENVNEAIKKNTNMNASNKSSEIKYLPVQLTEVSNERELKALTTNEQEENYCINKNALDGNTTPAKIIYYNRKDTSPVYQQKEYVQGLKFIANKNITLAEHKAQLRADFFQNKETTRIITEYKLEVENSLKFVKQRKYYLENKLQRQSSYNRIYNNKNINIKALTTLKYFPKVQELVNKFEEKTQQKLQITKYQKKMIVNNMTASDNDSNSNNDYALKSQIVPQPQQQSLHSPLSDEGCNLAQSPYCSSDEDNESIRTASTAIERPFKRKEKVARSASSDSALGLEVDEATGEISAIPPNPETQTKRRMTLTVTDLPLRPALLPLAEPTALPDSTGSTEFQQTLQTLMTQTAIPSKVLLEERVVELPVDSEPVCPTANSRRESAQSCISDYPLSECSGVRYMRTPSVVVSDYSDDVMCGITLEEIEYFRAQRVGRRCSSLDTTGTEKDGDLHSDNVSAASSCSNLYYCGSTISALDGSECIVNGERMPLKRKSSDSSNFSATGECEDITHPPQREETDTDLSALLAAQHLDIKKVGLTPKVVVSRAEN